MDVLFRVFQVVTYSMMQVTPRSSGATLEKSVSFSSTKNNSSNSLANASSIPWGSRDVPSLSRAEAMASTAVRAADKVQVLHLRMGL